MSHGGKATWKSFDPAAYEAQLSEILRRVAELPRVDAESLHAILREVPKDGNGFFSRSDLIAGLRALAPRRSFGVDRAELERRLRRKPVRTRSGVAPVTVMTAPHRCPGHCVFCPSEAGMPKSYLASEPGAQRALANAFDPFLQTWNRVAALHQLGHPVDKIELLILGGTWSAYPLPYRVWFVRRCLEALNRIGAEHWRPMGPEVGEERRPTEGPRAEPDWEGLARAQRCNERAGRRCVGLVLETRPDHVDAAEVLRMRRLGATKVQLGVQSLSDDILRLSGRGHNVAESRAAVGLLRSAGFKIHLHWMPNLVGATPASDRDDFARLFDDPALRPDELKIYPCSLVAGTELMELHRRGVWRPYELDELVDLLVDCLARTPEYCRVSRMIRDIPGDEIVAGSRVTNLRQVVEGELERRGSTRREIRGREIGGGDFDPRGVAERSACYTTEGGEEVFLQALSDDDRLLAFLRLSLPRGAAPVSELEGAAVIREVHVYGAAARLPGSAEGDDRRGGPQHRGLGRRLVERAERRALRRGYRCLAVISAVGTRGYYRGLGFTDGELYQHRALDGEGKFDKSPEDAGDCKV